FSCSDPQASLPGNAVLHAGTGSFSATLKTAGMQSLRATDVVTATITGIQEGIKITPLAARLELSSPATATAGSGFSITVIALDSSSGTVTGYRGTVHFTCSDAHATLPADYTFTAADAGVHKFACTLKTAGRQEITAADSANGFSGTKTEI